MGDEVLFEKYVPLISDFGTLYERLCREYLCENRGEYQKAFANGGRDIEAWYEKRTEWIDERCRKLVGRRHRNG